MNKILRFLYSFCAVTVTAAVCSYFTQTGITSFYASLELPLFTPPNAVFPVVWSALYALMIVSFYDPRTFGISVSKEKKIPSCLESSAERSGKIFFSGISG